jgi:hypothetical protein
MSLGIADGPEPTMEERGLVENDENEVLYYINFL